MKLAEMSEIRDNRVNLQGFLHYSEQNFIQNLLDIDFHVAPSFKQVITHNFKVPQQSFQVFKQQLLSDTYNLMALQNMAKSVFRWCSPAMGQRASENYQPQCSRF